MKKITFDFLKTMELKEIEKAPLTPSNSKSPGPNADLRLFADGSLYPSAGLVALHHLEYQPEGSETPENGYDVFVSTDWGQYTGDVPFVALALVSKHEPRVSLFSQTKYKDGKPVSSVLTQKTTAGEDLITALSKVYLEKSEEGKPAESLFGDKPYLDLAIMTTEPLKTASGVYHLPKTVAKGKDVGKPTYVRRENILIFPLTIVEEEEVAGAPTPIATVPAETLPKTEAVTASATSKAAAAVFGN